MLQAGIDAANKALDKKDCDDLVGAESRSQDPADLRGVLKDGGVETADLGLAKVSPGADSNAVNINYTLGATNNGSIQLNTRFFPDPTANNIPVSANSSKSILEVFNQAYGSSLTAVQLEPLRESATRTLIAVHLAERNINEAVRRFELFRADLGRELGVAPTPWLERLVRAGLHPG